MNSNEDNVLIHNDPVVQMPTVTAETVAEQSKLVTVDITEAITGDKVKRLLLPEGSEIADKNFIFDFSKIETITVFQKEALKTLIRRDGDVALYLYKKNGLVEFGRGEKYSLEREIPLIRHYIFGDEIEIYKNFQPDKPVEAVAGRDITKMRLNL